MDIILFAALPQEYGPFRKMTGRWRCICRKPFRTFELCSGGKRVRLIETGMGGSCAEKASAWAFDRSVPDLIVSCGFAGSLGNGLDVGRVVSGETFCRATAEGLDDAAGRYVVASSADFVDFRQREGMIQARIVTAAGPVDKRLLGDRLCGGPALLDMETFVFAKLAFGSGIPFVSVRAVSDGLHDDIGFDLADITGANGRILLSGVLSLVVRNPGVVRAFYASGKRSFKAAKAMGTVLAEFLSLPVVDLGRMVAGCVPKERG